MQEAEKNGESGGAVSSAGRNGGAAQVVAAAKAQFMRMAEAYDPLDFVQKKPYASMGYAMLLGFVFTSLRPRAMALPLLSLVAQIGDTVSRFVHK